MEVLKALALVKWVIVIIVVIIALLIYPDKKEV